MHKVSDMNSITISLDPVDRFIKLLWHVGFWAYGFPLSGKQPRCNWRSAPNLPGVIGTPEQWHGATGYGIAMMNRTSIVLDIDDPDHSFVRQVIRALPSRMKMVVASGKGYHHYMIAAFDQPAGIMPKQVMNTETGAVREIASLRSEGAYIVGPGSRHPSGAVYRPVTPGDYIRPLQLTEGETAALYELFTPGGGNAPLGENSPNKPPNLRNGAFTPKTTKNGPKVLNQRLLSEVFRRVEMWQGRPLVWQRSARGETASLWRNFTREDKHRSSFISRETGIVHDRAGRRLTLPELCNLLGIRMNDYGGLYE